MTCTTNELLEALNHIDGFADEASESVDDKQELAKSYNFLYHFIVDQTKENPKLDDIEILQRENKAMADKLKSDGYNDEEISNIANSAFNQ